MIRLDDIAGYVSERNVWLLMSFLAERSVRHGLGAIKADDITVRENGFGLETEERRADEKDDVWHIGALAFYAVMGVEVLNVEESGGGTTVQRIPSAHASNELSSLIHSCLNPERQMRPSAEDIYKKAENILAKKPLPVRSISTNSGKAYKESLVKFWPEEMTCLIILIMGLLIPLSSAAQHFPAGIPEQMKTLVRRCVDLRTPGNEEAVSKGFEDDHSWTMLDEIDMDKDECTIHDQVNELGVNMICSPILLERQGVVNTGGVFVSGEDPRYNYSLIELTAKVGTSLEYDIEKRQGTQTFAVIPNEAGTIFSVKLEENGIEIANPVYEDGICYIRSLKKMSPDDIFRIIIVNESGRNMSFVLINHNARD